MPCGGAVTAHRRRRHLAERGPEVVRFHPPDQPGAVVLQETTTQADSG